MTVYHPQFDVWHILFMPSRKLTVLILAAVLVPLCADLIKCSLVRILNWFATLNVITPWHYTLNDSCVMSLKHFTNFMIFCTAESIQCCIVLWEDYPSKEISAIAPYAYNWTKKPSGGYFDYDGSQSRKLCIIEPHVTDASKVPEL